MAMGVMTPMGEIYRGLRAKSWLAAAMIVEFLSLAGAISAIPSLGLLPLIWALAAVGILSTVGVLIITAHFILEHNRRPLNDVQRAEVVELLSAYLSAEQAQELAPKSELSGFVARPELFWLWRYQKSVLELAWATYELYRQPGAVLVAELLAGTEPMISTVEFSFVPPPVKDLGECLTDVGESPPRLYQDWGTIFRTPGEVILFYLDSQRATKYLYIEQRMAFDDHLVAPVPVSRTARTKMPVLAKQQREVARPGRDWPYEWRWVVQEDA